MRMCTDPSPLRIAVSFGTVSYKLATLLGRQRIEEPQTLVRLHEIGLADQIEGLAQGHYDGGIALTDAPGSSLQARALWHEELVVVMSAESPLCRHEAVPVAEAARYPIIGWEGPVCEPLSTLVKSLFKQSQLAQVRSYDLMAVLILAGYGIGIGLRSRICWIGTPKIVFRPLLDCQSTIATYLLQPRMEHAATALDRLVERARQISDSD